MLYCQIEPNLQNYVAESSADFYIVILKHRFIFRLLSLVPAILYERILLQNYVHDVYCFLGCDVMSLTKTYRRFGRTYCFHLEGRSEPGNVDRGLASQQICKFLSLYVTTSQKIVISVLAVRTTTFQ
jgi:hypothetical protein